MALAVRGRFHACSHGEGNGHHYSAGALRMAGVTKIRGQPKNISLPHQFVFAVIMAVHLLVFSLIGGAALARYMLPAIPLVIIIAVSTLRRRIPGWPVLIALVCAGFVAGLLINPPYVFAPEDNL